MPDDLLTPKQKKALYSVLATMASRGDSKRFFPLMSKVSSILSSEEQGTLYSIFIGIGPHSSRLSTKTKDKEEVIQQYWKEGGGKLSKSEYVKS
tara:strand:- start:2827 stop:3108 length:282 start_codon:yes stop_codon:yes gene_type:complete